MKTELVQALTTNFEAHAQQTETGIEFWLARDIQYLLGYTKWDNFLNVVSKAKTACEVSGHAVPDHFADVGKTIAMPKGAEKEVPDLMLTRYACYLIAQNGDPKKQEIAFAQTYFAIQTRKAELIEQRLLDAERVSARKKLSATEYELSEVIFEQVGGSNQGPKRRRCRSAPCTWPKVWNFVRWSSWLAMTKSCPCRVGFKTSPTRLICRRSITRSGICFMLPAPAPETGCLSLRPSLHPSFLMIC